MRDREARAASVAIGVLPELGLAGSAWVAGDPEGRVEAALAGMGVRVLAWRRSGPGATAWPEGRGLADGALLRLPKGREAARMALHALAARTRPGAPLVLYGANDEGIRSADALLGELFEGVRTLDARRHCRAWLGTRRDDVEIRGALDDWAETVEARLPSGPARWVSFPGLFAHGHLDPATALLLESLEPFPPGARVLDYGCGAGVIGLELRARDRGLELHAQDPDPLAREATRRNLPGVVLHDGPGLGALPEALRFDRIVSNPPLHSGRTQHHGIVEALCREAPARLLPGGELWIVAQRTVPVERLVGPGLGEPRRVASTRSFRVHCARIGPGARD